MKTLLLLLLMVGLVATGWHYREKIGLGGRAAEPGEEEVDASAVSSTSPPPPSPDAPPATPHPGTDSMALARRLYPALNMKDSAFRKQYEALYANAKAIEPELLARADWPIKLAERTTLKLGGAPMPLPTPTRPLLESGPSGLQGSALDQRPGKKR